MYDYIFSHTSSAAAAANSNLSGYYLGPSSQWNQSAVIYSDTWNPANDSTQTTVVGGSTFKTIVHTMSTTWECIIASTARVPAWESDSNFLVALDRDAANGGALPATYIVAFNASKFPSVISMLNTLRFQPVFAGAHYPALGIST